MSSINPFFLVTTIVVFSIVTACAGVPEAADQAMAGHEAAAGEVPALVGLRGLAAARGLDLGVALDHKALGIPIYARTAAAEFNSVTAENVMKWETMEPLQGSFEWFFADTLLDFAATHTMKVRGHTLVWHSQLPAWVKALDSRESVLGAMENHVRTIVGHYKGRVGKWDVVNEVIEDDGTLRKSVFSELTGPDFIAQAFRTAHEVDPDALLYINDYSVEWIGPKSDALHRTVKDLLSRGVPIHGVGFQSHWDLDQMPSMESFAANIKRFTDLGLLVDITELDIRFAGPATPERLEAQARAYRNFMEVILATERTDSVTLWGLDDGHSWIPKWRAGLGNALLLDRKYLPKPAYFAIADSLR